MISPVTTISDEGNTSSSTKDPGSTTKQPDPDTEQPESTTSASKGDQRIFHAISTTSLFQVLIVEVPVGKLAPVKNVFVMKQEK